MRLILKAILIGVCSNTLCCWQGNSTTTLPENTAAALCGGGAGPVLAVVDTMRAPKRQAGMGNSHLTITTNSASAQQWFDYGINLLHNFAHVEAYRVFREVVKADPQCAMGWWGIAMCQPGFGGIKERIWQQAIDKAVSLKPQTAPLEADFIEAARVLFQNGIQTQETVAAFRALQQKYPQEPEAGAFAAIVLRQNVRTNDNSGNEVKQMLETLLGRFPDHTGLLHYYTHVMEVRPDFLGAKKYAEKMVGLAPNASHIRHMPGHIYFLEGNYPKAIEVFEAARTKERAWHRSENIPPSFDQNYMHNLHYLAIAYSEHAQRQQALEVAEEYANITLRVQAPTNGATLMLLYEGRILPALVLARFGEYSLAAEKIAFWLNSIDFPIADPFVKMYLQVMYRYNKGMEAVLGGRMEEAGDYGMELSKLMHEYEQQGAQMRGSPEFKVINECFDVMSMARYELAGWIDNMDKSKPFNDAAWKAALDHQAAIQYDEPPRLVYPIEESMARLHRWRGELAEAERAKQKALRKRPNSPMVMMTDPPNKK